VVFDTKTGTCTELPRRPNTVTFYPDWSPDGKHICYLEATELKDDAGIDMQKITAWEQTWSPWIADADGTNARRLMKPARELTMRSGPGMVLISSTFKITLYG